MKSSAVVHYVGHATNYVLNLNDLSERTMGKLVLSDQITNGDCVVRDRCGFHQICNLVQQRILMVPWR